MSKSDPSDNSRINLTDSDDEIINKIKKAKTDSQDFPNDIKSLKARPEIENLLGIYACLSNKKTENLLDDFSGKNFTYFKEKLAEVVISKVSPISKEIKKIKNDVTFIDNILFDGSEKAKNLSSKKIQEIKNKFGF